MLRALFQTASILQLLLTNLIIALNITKYNYKPKLFFLFSPDNLIFCKSRIDLIMVQK